MATKKEIVSESNFEELLIESAKEALEYTKGERGLKTHFASLIEEPPKYSKSRIKKIRQKLGLSQSLFATIFGVSTSAVQHWEQGLRHMPSPARRLLNLLEKDPKTVFELITLKEAS
jgi:putative transcriptional regulator